MNLFPPKSQQTEWQSGQRCACPGHVRHLVTRRMHAKSRAKTTYPNAQQQPQPHADLSSQLTRSPSTDQQSGTGSTFHTVVRPNSQLGSSREFEHVK
ncbi:hypothetical protein [Oryza sativa Japonica Group]|uniref:Uncharacterized protein n=1 Tax=Oryza sativa subsp. japonica TaxID=39947 RepID=Q8LQ89_ORYSJ|nr:hypothetical protein [Oryza sativa Japonica Group]